MGDGDEKNAQRESERREERALVWKIDLILMPLLTITYGLQYYDKSVLGSAAVFGIIKDLHLSTTTKGVVSTIRYSTASSAFYWGYIVGVAPWALLLTRLPLAKTIGVIVSTWGLVALLTIVCTSYEGLVVERVFLGFAEASVSPAFVAVTTLWYTKSEQATRLGIWYSATGIFSIFSGLVNYGLGHSGGGSPWKNMYAFVGSLTIAWGILLFFILPEAPSSPGRFFTEAERAILIRRHARNLTGLEKAPLSWRQAKEALTDVKIYFFLLMGAAIYVVNGGVTAFGARIVSSFGYSSLTTIIIVIPGGAFTMVTIYLFGYLAGKFKDARTYLLPISCIPVIVGAGVIWKASWVHRGVPLFGYYLLATFGAPYVLLLAISAANIAGSTKRAIATSAIGYNVGNIIGPYLIFTPERPIKYRSTWISVIVVMCVSSALSLGLRFLMSRENARRDRLGATANDAEELDRLGEPLTDLTDGENLRFRYSL